MSEGVEVRRAQPASCGGELREHAAAELRVPTPLRTFTGRPNGARRSIGIAVSRFNGEVTQKLLDGALETLEELGVAPEAIEVMPVPGAFELPLGAMALARSRRYSAVVALGCIIRGDTPHFEYVSVGDGKRDPARGARDGDPGLVRRAHLRHERAGARPRRGGVRQQGRRGCPLGPRDGRVARPAAQRDVELTLPSVRRPGRRQLSSGGDVEGLRSLRQGPSFGNSRSHSMVATKRRFEPNLQRVRVLLDGVARRAYVCTRCLKAGKVQKAV